MIYRSKAPLRIGLAGGGTDVSPYCDEFGGAVLNATISLYARASIIPLNEPKVILHAVDRGIKKEFIPGEIQDPGFGLDLHAGVYNRIARQFAGFYPSIEITTSVDVPPGSGLGTSSALVVAIIGAFQEMLALPLGEYDIAQLAFEIERIDLGMAGGRQDQYASTFGGFNFMEFSAHNKVIVNPLRIKQKLMDELAHNLVLFYTLTNRNSSKIIEDQARAIAQKNKERTEATHHLKEQAILMKEALLEGRLHDMGEILNYGWQHKKLIAEGISNPELDEIYQTAIAHGAIGGKISGAGGGGFMTFYCPENTRHLVIQALSRFNGYAVNYEFTTMGLTTWSYENH